MALWDGPLPELTRTPAAWALGAGVERRPAGDAGSGALATWSWSTWSRRSTRSFSHTPVPCRVKERKKTDKPNEGWEEDRVVPTCTSRILEDDQGHRWGSPAPDKARGTRQARSAVHGGLPTPLAVSSQSSDLPPASHRQSLTTTGTLTQGWQGRRHESPTYYAGLTRGAACACPRDMLGRLLPNSFPLRCTGGG